MAKTKNFIARLVLMQMVTRACAANDWTKIAMRFIRPRGLKAWGLFDRPAVAGENEASFRD